MKKNIDDMLRNVKLKKLTSEEKSYLWSNISNQLKLSRQTQKIDQNNRLYYFAVFGYKKIIAAATLVAFLVLGTATAWAFDDIHPGDFFFPVDIAAEKILLILTFGDTEDVFRLRFAEERLDEVLALLALAESIEIEGTSDTSTDSSDGTGTTTDDDTTTTVTASSDDESDESSDNGTTTENGTNENGVDLIEEEFLNSFDFDIDTIEDALLFALAQLEESKAVFAANGNANGVVAINSFIDQLNDLALNHIDKLDRVAVTIKDGGNEDVKIKISISSHELKRKFEFTETTDSDGNTTQKVTFRNEDTSSSLRSDEDGGFKFSFNFRNKDKDDKNGKDGDDGEDGKGGKKNKNKIKVCHKDKKTLSISKNARWAHHLHGESLGPCEKDDDDDNNDDDTTAPEITNVVADPAVTTAEVAWFTDEDATSLVWYSTTSPVVLDFPNPVEESAVLTQYHVLVLNDLVANTIYYYVVSSEDESGNKATSTEHSFTTDPEPDPGDTTPPIISNISTSSDMISADVSWTTDENATSKVWFSTESPVVLDTPTEFVSSSGLVQNRTLTLNGLTASTTYFYIVESEDAEGNIATSSEQTFTTDPELELADTTPPIISALNDNVATTEAVITWITDENADSTVFYSISSPVDPDTADSVENISFVTIHSLDLINLTASPTYYYLVVSSYESGNTSTSTENSFTITSEPEPEDTTPPMISTITSFDIGTTTLAISWTTDEIANGKLWYGEGDPLIAMVSHSDFITAHELLLGGLVASTTYQFLIVSTDEFGNTATSTQQTVTTISQ